MTIYQEAHTKIDQFPEDTVYLFVQLMNKMNLKASDEGKTVKSKEKFLESAGKIDVDAKAIDLLREASMI